MPMVRFVPTAEQRADVIALAQAGITTLEEIAQKVINPRTQRAISVKVLSRLFKPELAEAPKLLILGFQNLREALLRKEIWATKLVVGPHLEKMVKDAPAGVTNNEIQNINVLFPGLDGPGLGGKKHDEPQLPSGWQDRREQRFTALPPPHHNGRPTIDSHTIDSTEEGRIRPLYGEVKPAPEPAAEPTAPYPMRPEDLPQLTLKQRREAKEERFKAEGFSEWSDFDSPFGPRSGNPNSPSRNGKFIKRR